MSKKLGITFLFIGAYATLIGGLTWVMHFTKSAELSQLCKPYDWVWGLMISIVLFIGSVMACKGYIYGLIGLDLVLDGLFADIYLLIFGITKQSFLSPLILTGIIGTGLGFVLTLIAHIWKMRHIAIHGNSMLK